MSLEELDVLERPKVVLINYNTIYYTLFYTAFLG